MRIGTLLWELDVPGGTQRQALHLARELARRGDDVVVYCAKGKDAAVYPELREGLTIRSLEGVSSGSVRPAPRFRMVRRWTGRDPESVRGREMAQGIPGELDLLNVHDYLVHQAGSFWKERTAKPVVWMMNDLPAGLNDARSPANPWKRAERFLKGKHREQRRRCDSVLSLDSIVVLDDRNRELVGKVLGMEATVVRSGLDLDAFPWTPREPPSAERPIRILSNAIFFPWRRLEDIVSALAILREREVPFRWTHVGTDSRDRRYAEGIYAEVRRLGLAPAVSFLGEIPEKDLRLCFREADLFLFPNSPQTWGLAVFQAMACGTPVVVSRGAGAAEVLTDGENAVLVDPCSPSQIARAILRLREDREFWRRLHVAGRRFVERNIRWDLYAEEMRKIFLRLSSGKESGSVRARNGR